MVYIFLGEDSLAKDAHLKKLRQESFPEALGQFNFDTLYAKEIKLVDLQEKLLNLPVKGKSRLIVVKNAEKLKEDIKEFLLGYARKPCAEVILVLDMQHYDARDNFIRGISAVARLVRFKESLRADTFLLYRLIQSRKPDNALLTLHQLLEEGERPERILGGLRYASQKDSGLKPLEKKKILEFLLSSDIDIKTGKVAVVYALERLMVRLCCGKAS